MIKNTIKKIILGIGLFIAIPALATCQLGLKNPGISPTPVEYLKTAEVLITPYNLDATAIPASDGFGSTCKFKIQLSLLSLKGEDVANITDNSNLNTYFDITYDSNTSFIYFVQKAEIPGDWESHMIIPVDVTGESTAAQSQNGFQANVFNSSQEGSDFTYTKESNNTTLPDYRPTVILNGSPITGASGEVSLVVKIGEFNGGLNTSAVKVFIPKNTSLALTFNSEDTEIAGEVVSNSQWKLTEISSGYLFEYKGNNGQYPVQERRNIGLTGVYTSGTKQAGNVTVEATILTGNGESIISNNKDTSILSFNNIN